MGQGRSIAVAIAAAATLLATGLCSLAIKNAQWGPSWEVPVAVVTELYVARLASVLLIPTAVGILLWRARTVTGSLGVGLLFAQVVLAAVLASLSSVDQAGQWPGRNPGLSRHAGEIALAASLASTLLGTLGAMTWRCAESPRKPGT
jgi:hypothetical protein